MNKIRIGKDLTIQWNNILIGGQVEALTGKNLKVVLKMPNGNTVYPEYSVVGTNGIQFSFPGTKQKVCGVHSVTLWLNYGTSGQSAIDKTMAFELVKTTEEEQYDNYVENLDTVPIQLSSGDFVVGFKGKDGKDYVLTEADKNAIAAKVQVSSGVTSYNDLTDKPTIPSIEGLAKDSDLATVAKSGKYTDLTDKPNIPTKTSNLTNDSNFISDANYQHTDNNYTDADKTAVGKVEELSLNQGTLSSLTTNTKTDLVSAINEVNAKPSGGGEPSAYIKSASVSGNTLNLTNKDNTTTTYTPTIPSTPTWNEIKPTDGIALADLASTLQTSISRADEIYNDYISAQNLI